MPYSEPALNFKIFLVSFLYLPLISLLTWLDLNLVSMSSLAVLLGIDYITGIFKVHRLKGSIKSYRALSGLLTKGTILLLVFSLAFMAKGIKIDFKSYLDSFIALLLISETYSIFGNAYSIKTAQETEEFDAVAAVIKKMRRFIENIIRANRDI